MRGLTRPLSPALPASRLPTLLVAALMLLAALVTGPGAAQAQDPARARTLVSEVAEVGITEVLNSALPQAEKVQRFRNLFTTYFDIPSIGRFVLGRHWRAASEAEQQEFLKLFQEINVFTWARRFGDYNGQKLAIGQAMPDGDNGAIVDSSVEQAAGQQPISVQWRLRERGDTYKVVDLVIEGVSMAITYRQEYNSVISQSGGSVSALNRRLEDQLKRLRSEQGL